MAATYGGSCYFGPLDPSNDRYYSHTGWTLPDSDWSMGVIVRIEHGELNPHSLNDTTYITPLRTETFGGGGSDSFFRLAVNNHNSASVRLILEGRIAVGGVIAHSGARLTGTTKLSLGVNYCLIIQRNGSNMELYICEQGGSASLEDSDTHNASFTSKTLGTLYPGRQWHNYLQASWVGDKALSTGEIESIAAGADLESIYSVAQRRNLHLFDSFASTITDAWGSKNATLTGDVTYQPECSPIVPNASTYIDCDSTKSLLPVGIAPGETTATLELSGTYTGFTPATFEYRLLNAFDKDEAVSWTSLSSFSVSAGDWSGSFTAPAGMYLVQVRDSVATSTIWKGGNPLAFGAVVCTIGQSPMSILEGAPTPVTDYSSTRMVVLSDNRQELYLASVSNSGGGYEAMGYEYFSGDAIGELCLIPAAVVGTSSGQWAAEDSTQFAGAMTAVDTAAPKGHVSFAWLNGGSDSDVAGLPDNHDTIYANLATEMLARGLTYWYTIIPHQRDTGHGNTDYLVRNAQRQWCITHIDFGAGVDCGPCLCDIRLNVEHTGVIRAVTSTTTQLAADYEGVAAGPPLTIVVDGVEKSVSSYNESTKTCTHTAWAVLPTANVSTYKAYGTSTHQASSSSRRMGFRIGCHFASWYGYSEGADGPTMTSATYPNGGDGQLIDCKFTHVNGANLRTNNDGNSSSNVFGFEVSTDGGSNYSDISAATITDSRTVRIDLGSPPSDPADLRVRYLGSGSPVDPVDFLRLEDLVLDDSGVGDTDGVAAWFSSAALSVTEAAAGGGAVSYVLQMMHHRRRRSRGK